ncbi:hypothetical protein EW146_g521 [Bondarzewia mesenterica]|uniref:Importin-13 n=1 Tax=Bondarzewia mesenterica TaxID=1095465 RepID=A0A4S4M6P6_9AGAM|nr:hypothetical protein EW146_g521 [Bondarzewia mesenterica]
MSTFLPILSSSDVYQAAQLIQQSYTPSPAKPVSPEGQRRLQQDLFELQKKWEAWGLVVPFLEHEDPNVQFFGAHTAQVKIARDWQNFPKDHAVQLKELLLDVTGKSIVTGRSKVILRKLFVSLSSLALKLSPTEPSQWPDWILATIAAEEISGADLLAPKKSQMQQTLLDAVPMVTQAINVSLTSRGASTTKQFDSAMKCFEAWMHIFRANDLTPLIQPLFGVLNPASLAHFLPATSAFLSILSTSVLSSGAAPRTLTEPLLLWFAQWGTGIVGEVMKDGTVDEIGNALCKLLTGLGDHSSDYLAENIASHDKVQPAFVPVSVSLSGEMPTKGQLVQTFLRLLLSFTSLPGYYGVDEEESEMTLDFWYLFQEALWSVDIPESEDGEKRDEVKEKELWDVARAVYAELVSALRRKVKWPGSGSRWAKDQIDKFLAYRRDVGDTLINAYYVLRDDMLAYYVNDIVDRLSKGEEVNGWEEIEATLHCIMSIQEPVPQDPNAHLSRLFSPEILGRLPTTGNNRVRRTTLGVIGSYSSWFTSLPPTTNLLMSVITYVVAALPEPSLCLSAANALRDLCDANRTALAPHIGAFGELHAGLVGVPDTEKAKVLQSIASVIQALPAQEGIPPVEAIIIPVVANLVEALQSSNRLPEEARILAIHQLHTLASVAKGLTRTADVLTLEDASMVEETEKMQHAREDSRAVRLREEILNAVSAIVELWSTDAGTSDALSDLFKSITALPADASLISLPPAPLLELVCRAAQRQLTAVWLSLANMLVVQLDPPSLRPTALRAVPSLEAIAIVRDVVNVLVQTSLNFLSVPNAMEAASLFVIMVVACGKSDDGHLTQNPDIVQDFFDFVEKVAFHFVAVFYQLAPGSFDALIRCAVTSLALQERYSLVAAAKFLSTLINRTHASDDLGDARTVLAQTHGPAIMRAVLAGFAGVAPRSAAPNLIEVLSTLVAKYPAESRAWMSQILFSDDFVHSRAGPEAKEKFIKTVFGTRSIKRTRDAAQQFMLVARGLEDSSFGYASVTM